MGASVSGLFRGVNGRTRQCQRALCAVAVFAVSTLAAGQAPSRLVTTAETLVSAPVFFHGKQVVIRHEVLEQSGLWQLAGTRRPVFVMWKERPSLGADSEIRGEFWDLGRLQRDDPRFTGIDFTGIIEAASHGQWPARDQVFVIVGATAVVSPLPTDPNIRAIALAPERYADRGVTVTGRFRGANLYGDLPLPVSKSRWDFVLQSADAAVWVAGMRPRGKGFDLDPGARVDTGRWLQVAGTLRHEGALTWIDATSIAPGAAPTETEIEVAVPPAPREVAPQVIFSAPLADEIDADRAAPIRIQFSRDMEAKSFRDRVKVSYVGQAPAGAPAAPSAFTVRYNEGSRGIEIRFATPLDRFRKVQVDLLEGITSAVDNQPLAAWSLTFTTGG